MEAPPTRRTQGLGLLENSGGRGAVFAERRVAESVARIHSAIRTALTWGEFRDMLLPPEYEEVLDNLDTDHVPEQTPFRAGDVPGYLEGLYPLRLQTVAARWLPADVTAAHGTWQDSPAGPHWSSATQPWLWPVNSGAGVTKSSGRPLSCTDRGGPLISAAAKARHREGLWPGPRTFHTLRFSVSPVPARLPAPRC